jgi:hypothetical protein
VTALYAKNYALLGVVAYHALRETDHIFTQRGVTVMIRREEFADGQQEDRQDFAEDEQEDRQDFIEDES